MISLQLERKKNEIGKAYKMKLDVLKGEPTALIQIAFAPETRGWGGGFALQVFLKKPDHQHFILAFFSFKPRSRFVPQIFMPNFDL